MSPRKAARRLLPLYEKHVGPWAKVASGMATCRRGCNHCCYNLVGSTLAEGVLIASLLLEDSVLSKDLPRLKAVLQEQLVFVMGLDARKSYAYLEAKRPCAFLDQESGDCRVYEHRPTACRTYYVVSDPSQCSPDRPGAETLYVDASPALKTLLPALLDETSRIPPVTGALQAMVLLGLEMLTVPKEQFDALLAQADPGM